MKVTTMIPEGMTQEEFDAGVAEVKRLAAEMQAEYDAEIQEKEA